MTRNVVARETEVRLTSTQCSVCGLAAIVLLTHSLRIGKRLVQWTECRRCYAQAEADHAAA